MCSDKHARGAGEQRSIRLRQNADPTEWPKCQQVFLQHHLSKEGAAAANELLLAAQATAETTRIDIVVRSMLMLVSFLFSTPSCRLVRLRRLDTISDHQKRSRVLMVVESTR
mmetsp:Transcript_44423/g.135404  ORF Transcript_44423/g.135404 Transcript_44423/m.135404 type:complete len:112 (-) Transcript_44423:953-1288(-)